MRERLSAALTVAAVCLLVSGLGRAHAQQRATVDVRDNEFVEADITVTAGDSVEWTQTGMNPHSVTADDGSFDSHPNCLPACMSQGETFTHTFETEGEHRYYCKIHGGPGGQGMSGVIRVQAASQPEPTSTTAPVVTSTTAPTATSTSTTTTAPPATSGETPPPPPTVEAAPQRLPDTGSPLPLLLAAGAAMVVGGGLVRRVGRRSPR